MELQTFFQIGITDIDDDAIGIFQGKEGVLHLATGIENHTGIVRRRPHTDPVDLRLCLHQGGKEQQAQHG